MLIRTIIVELFKKKKLLSIVYIGKEVNQVLANARS